MSKFFILGTYSPESYEGFIKNPEQDRKALAQALAKAMGAKITGMDFLRGSYDFIATIEAENFEDLAAVKLTFEATRAGKMTILESVDINKIAKKAGTAMANYVPPASN
jgi:uncharacterized protein with GYD domain|tara:strand:- start:396 stop:722 length:327 start_codon:yes stop_codon:yes gene_type:complete